MSEKKHIDRLFQEQFKNFEAKPSAKVWSSIEKDLKKQDQKSRPIIPLWIKYASIAALLLLFFAIGNAVFNTSENIENTNPSVVDTDIENASKTDENTSNENTNNNSSESNATFKDTPQKNLIANEKTDVINNVKHSSKNNTQDKKSTKNNIINGTNNNSNNYQAVTKYDRKNESTKYDKDSDAQRLINNSTSSKSNQVIAQRSTSNNTSTSSNGTVIKTPSNLSNANSVSSSETDKTGSNKSIYSTQNNPLDKSGSINNSNSNANTIAATNSEKEEEKMMDKEALKELPNAIEETLAKTEDLDEKEKEKLDRWSVNANIAPVYYNSLGKGSHFHDQFVENKKNGEVNTSYGIHVGYALNERFKVRTGINKLDLSYDTADVIVYETVSNTPASAPLRNIKFNSSNNQSISVLSAESVGVQQLNGALSSNSNAALSQRLSYIEVPVEVEYAIINKRFGLHIIGGVSTFILSDNEVVSEFEDFKTPVGEATNINNVSFSTNLGLGIDYKFSDAFKFNLEPTFKYQINAYNETSGDFRPYIIGVYTGFSYKF